MGNRNYALIGNVVSVTIPGAFRSMTILTTPVRVDVTFIGDTMTLVAVRLAVLARAAGRIHTQKAVADNIGTTNLAGIADSVPVAVLLGDGGFTYIETVIAVAVAAYDWVLTVPFIAEVRYLVAVAVGVALFGASSASNPAEERPRGDGLIDIALVGDAVSWKTFRLTVVPLQLAVIGDIVTVAVEADLLAHTTHLRARDLIAARLAEARIGAYLSALLAAPDTARVTEETLPLCTWNLTFVGNTVRLAITALSTGRGAIRKILKVTLHRPADVVKTV